MTGDSYEHQKKSYRPEIDGLRAVSVLGVILYHFQIGLPSGYLGVDVFFVISGYLITSIIVREIEAGSFSIRNFWVRRIRRILPAASMLCASVLTASVFIMSPESIVKLAESCLAQILIISNVYFWKEAGYFSTAAELSPMLHTWSLSIEEQFYVCLPIFLILLSKFFKRGIVFSLVLALLLSLGLSIYVAIRSPEAAFYLLPTRAWELLTGSVAGIAFKRINLSRAMVNMLSVIGILLVVVPMFLHTEQTPLLGLNVMLPVFGSALFMVANSVSGSFVGKALSLRPIVFVGMISYSLYLWHWPMISFSRHMLIEIDGRDATCLLLLTLAVSILSWKFVENPFRHPDRFRRNGSAFLFATIVSSVLLIASGLLIMGKGFPGRFDSNTSLIMEDVHWTGTVYKEEIGEPLGNVRFGSNSKSPPDFVLWGDSHAMLMGEMVETLSAELGLHGVGFCTPAAPPVPGLWMPENPMRSGQDVLDGNKMRLDWIINQQVKHVILAGRWNAMCGTTGENEMVPGGVNPTSLKVIDSISTDETRTASIAALKRRLNRTVAELSEHGVTVWILVQAPEISQAELAKNFSLMHRFPGLNGHLPNESPSLEAYQRQRRDSLAIFQSLKSPNVRIIDPIDSFYTDGDTFGLVDSRAFYRDRDHLTRSGVERYLKPRIREVLEKILESR